MQQYVRRQHPRTSVENKLLEYVIRAGLLLYLVRLITHSAHVQKARKALPETDISSNSGIGLMKCGTHDGLNFVHDEGLWQACAEQLTANSHAFEQHIQLGYLALKYGLGTRYDPVRPDHGVMAPCGGIRRCVPKV